MKEKAMIKETGEILDVMNNKSIRIKIWTYSTRSWFRTGGRKAKIGRLFNTKK